MERRVLTDDDVVSFIEDGYLIVRDCFDPRAHWHWVEESLAKALKSGDGLTSYGAEAIQERQRHDAGQVRKSMRLKTHAKSVSRRIAIHTVVDYGRCQAPTARPILAPAGWT